MECERGSERGSAWKRPGCTDLGDRSDAFKNPLPKLRTVHQSCALSCKRYSVIVEGGAKGEQGEEQEEQGEAWEQVTDTIHNIFQNFKCYALII